MYADQKYPRGFPYRKSVTLAFLLFKEPFCTPSRPAVLAMPLPPRLYRGPTTPSLASLESVPGRLDGLQRPFLLEGEVGVPDVDDEDEPRVAAVVPHLVVEAVVENEQFALPPADRAVPDPHPGPLRDHQPQVSPQAAVGGAGVRVHVGAAGHHAELGLPKERSRLVKSCGVPTRRRKSGGPRGGRSFCGPSEARWAKASHLPASLFKQSSFTTVCERQPRHEKGPSSVREGDLLGLASRWRRAGSSRPGSM